MLWPCVSHFRIAFSVAGGSVTDDAPLEPEALRGDRPSAPASSHTARCLLCWNAGGSVLLFQSVETSGFCRVRSSRTSRKRVPGLRGLGSGSGPSGKGLGPLT